MASSIEDIFQGLTIILVEKYLMARRHPEFFVSSAEMFDSDDYFLRLMKQHVSQTREYLSENTEKSEDADWCRKACADACRMQVIRLYEHILDHIPREKQQGYPEIDWDGLRKARNEAVHWHIFLKPAYIEKIIENATELAEQFSQGNSDPDMQMAAKIAHEIGTIAKRQAPDAAILREAARFNMLRVGDLVDHMTDFFWMRHPEIPFDQLRRIRLDLSHPSARINLHEKLLEPVWIGHLADVVSLLQTSFNDAPYREKTRSEQEVPQQYRSVLENCEPDFIEHVRRPALRAILRDNFVELARKETFLPQDLGILIDGIFELYGTGVDAEKAKAWDELHGENASMILARRKILESALMRYRDYNPSLCDTLLGRLSHASTEIPLHARSERQLRVMADRSDALMNIVRKVMLTDIKAELEGICHFWANGNMEDFPAPLKEIIGRLERAGLTGIVKSGSCQLPLSVRVPGDLDLIIVGGREHYAPHEARAAFADLLDFVANRTGYFFPNENEGPGVKRSIIPNIGDDRYFMGKSFTPASLQALVTRCAQENDRYKLTQDELEALEHAFSEDAVANRRETYNNINDTLHSLGLAPISFKGDELESVIFIDSKTKDQSILLLPETDDRTIVDLKNTRHFKGMVNLSFEQQAVQKLNAAVNLVRASKTSRFAKDMCDLYALTFQSGKHGVSTPYEQRMADEMKRLRVNIDSPSFRKAAIALLPMQSFFPMLQTIPSPFSRIDPDDPSNLQFLRKGLQTIRERGILPISEDEIDILAPKILQNAWECFESLFNGQRTEAGYAINVSSEAERVYLSETLLKMPFAGKAENQEWVRQQVEKMDLSAVLQGGEDFSHKIADATITPYLELRDLAKHHKINITWVDHLPDISSQPIQDVLEKASDLVIRDPFRKEHSFDEDCEAILRQIKPLLKERDTPLKVTMIGEPRSIMPMEWEWWIAMVSKVITIVGDPLQQANAYIQRKISEEGETLNDTHNVPQKIAEDMELDLFRQTNWYMLPTHLAIVNARFLDKPRNLWHVIDTSSGTATRNAAYNLAESLGVEYTPTDSANASPSIDTHPDFRQFRKLPLQLQEHIKQIALPAYYLHVKTMYAGKKSITSSIAILAERIENADQPVHPIADFTQLLTFIPNTFFDENKRQGLISTLRKRCPEYSVIFDELERAAVLSGDFQSILSIVTDNSFLSQIIIGRFANSDHYRQTLIKESPIFAYGLALAIQKLANTETGRECAARTMQELQQSHPHLAYAFGSLEGAAIKKGILRKPIVWLWSNSEKTDAHIRTVGLLANRLNRQGFHVVFLASEKTLHRAPKFAEDLGITELMELPSLPTFRSKDTEVACRDKIKLLYDNNSQKPAAVITELWPMGFQKFNNILGPVLEHIKTQGKGTQIYHLAREIPGNNPLLDVEGTLEELFDGILVTGDEHTYKLHELEPQAESTRHKHHYLGHIIPSEERDQNIPDEDREVLLMSGSSYKSGTKDYIMTVMEAHRHTHMRDHTLTVLLDMEGCPPEDRLEIEQKAQQLGDGKITVIPLLNGHEFDQRLSNAALVYTRGGISLTQGAIANVPVVSFPVFGDTNSYGPRERQEQYIRAEIMQKMGHAVLVTEKDFTDTEEFARKVNSVVEIPLHEKQPVTADGPSKAVALIKERFQAQPQQIVRRGLNLEKTPLARRFNTSIRTVA